MSNIQRESSINCLDGSKTDIRGGPSCWSRAPLPKTKDSCPTNHPLLTHPPPPRPCAPLHLSCAATSTQSDPPTWYCIQYLSRCTSGGGIWCSRSTNLLRSQPVEWVHMGPTHMSVGTQDHFFRILEVKDQYTSLTSPTRACKLKADVVLLLFLDGFETMFCFSNLICVNYINQLLL